MSEIQQIAAAADSAVASLPRYTFTVPWALPEMAALRGPGDPSTVTLRQLTYSEEKAAMQAKENGGHSYEYEGAMRALDQVDGRAVTWDGNEKERTWESFHPMVRDLLAGGFMKFCLPTRKARDDFFASVKVTPGRG